MARIRTIEQFVDAYSEGLGRPMLPRTDWREVSTEWLGRYAEGAGDYNPLFRDPGYAAAGPNRSLVAPPGFVFSVDFGANASIWGHIPEADVDMHDLTILYLGNDIEWLRPIYSGDRIRSIETPVSVEPSPMRQMPDAVVCTGRTEYWNSRGELVARLSNRMLRFANQEQPVEHADVDLDKPAVAPDPLVWNRKRRGQEARFWNDVTVGEEIDTLPKGTFTTTELYMFALMVLGGSRSRSVSDGTIDMGAGGRADPEYARKSRAQAGSFDFGPQRSTWLLQAATDWAGDASRIVRASTMLRRPNIVGDTNAVSGRVARTYLGDGGEGLVDLVVENRNHTGALTASGVVTVELPLAGAVGSVPDIVWSSELRPVSDGPYG